MPDSIVTRLFREAIAEGSPDSRVSRLFREAIAEGSSDSRVSRLFREVIVDPGLTPDLLSDEALFTPQAVYAQTASMPLLSDEALFTPSWTQFFTLPLIDDGTLFIPVIPRSIQQSIFT